MWGRDDVDSVIVVCFDYGTSDIKELVKLHKSKSRKIMDTIEERVVNITSYDVDVDEVTDSGISCTVSLPNGPLDVSVYVMATFYADVIKGMYKIVMNYPRTPREVNLVPNLLLLAHLPR